MHSHFQSTPHWIPSGLYPVDAVGVSFVRDQIAAVAANPAGCSALVFCCASLVPYDGNEHDPNAVRVEILGKRVGHLSRELAVALRKRLTEIFSTPVTTTCDAVIFGGLVTTDESYNYTVSLDFDLGTAPSVDVSPSHPKPDRRDPEPKIVKSADGCYRATVWLDSHTLGDTKRNLSTGSWTTEHWTTVNYYLDNRQGIGLGHKLLGIEKDLNFQMFGSEEPEVVVESIEGRFVRICMIPEGVTTRRESE